MSSWSTCRFCGETADHGRMVQYGVRHYAHFNCYLDAGKSLDGLHDWQIRKFPFRLLKERGLKRRAKATGGPIRATDSEIKEELRNEIQASGDC